MITLALNTAAPEQFAALIKDNGILAEKKWMGRYDETEKLLRNIAALLKKQKLTFGNIGRIFAIKGPGNFSSVRIGVVIANTLAFALKIPLYALTADEFSSKFSMNLLKCAKAIEKNCLKSEKIVTPFYNKPPHITKKP